MTLLQDETQGLVSAGCGFVAFLIGAFELSLDAFALTTKQHGGANLAGIVGGNGVERFTGVAFFGRGVGYANARSIAEFGADPLVVVTVYKLGVTVSKAKAAWVGAVEACALQTIPAYFVNVDFLIVQR